MGSNLQTFKETPYCCFSTSEVWGEPRWLCVFNVPSLREHSRVLPSSPSQYMGAPCFQWLRSKLCSHLGFSLSPTSHIQPFSKSPELCFPRISRIHHVHCYHPEPGHIDAHLGTCRNVRAGLFLSLCSLLSVVSSLLCLPYPVTVLPEAVLWFLLHPE